MTSRRTSTTAPEGLGEGRETDTVRTVIVCGIDATEEALAAGGLATHLADRNGLGVMFVHVLEGRRPTAFEAAVARGLLASVIDTEMPRRGAVPLIEVGEPRERLAAIAREHRAAALVIGRAAGDQEPTALRGIADRAACPVLVVSGDGRFDVVHGRQSPADTSPAAARSAVA